MALFMRREAHLVRYVRFAVDGRAAWGRIEDRSVVPLAAAPYLGGLEAGAALPLEGLTLLAPAMPSKVLCVGLNYKTHRDDQQGPDRLVAGIIARAMDTDQPRRDPLLFLKAPSALVGPGEPIVLPPETERADFEAELALVIGRPLRRAVSRQEAADAIYGYTLANDVSARDIQERDQQWMRAKSFDSFCPLGPWVDTGFDPADREISGWLNGERRQFASTVQLIADPVELVRFASQAMTLLPGDVLLTGTPSGVDRLSAGDRFCVRVEGLGELCNPVRAEAG